MTKQQPFMSCMIQKASLYVIFDVQKDKRGMQNFRRMVFFLTWVKLVFRQSGTQEDKVRSKSVQCA